MINMPSVTTWTTPGTINLATQILQHDGVILATSDTVMGLLANSNAAGWQALDRIKKRTAKPYIMLLHDLDQVAAILAEPMSLPLQNLVEKCWPGPLTLIFKLKKTQFSFLPAEQSTIAVRVPRHAGLQHLLANFGGLFSTSANLASMPLPTTLTAVLPSLRRQVELIVMEEHGDQLSVIPSTILDCTEQSQPVLLRAGAYSVPKLEQLYGQKFVHR